MPASRRAALKSLPQQGEAEEKVWDHPGWDSRGTGELWDKQEVRRAFPGAIDSLRLAQGEGGDPCQRFEDTLNVQRLQNQLQAAAQELPGAAGTEQPQ